MMASCIGRLERFLFNYMYLKYTVKPVLRDHIWWIFPGTLISSTNKTDCHDIAEILLKVALNTITLTLKSHLEQKKSGLIKQVTS